MKKLLALLLVFGFASAAGAAAGDGTIELWIASVGDAPDNTNPITPTKEITIEASMWVDLKVVYHKGVDNGLLSGAKFDISINGHASFGDLGLIKHNSAFPATFTDVAFDPANDKTIWVTDAALFTGAQPESDVVWDVLVHCDADDPANEVRITLSDDDALFETAGGFGDPINVDPFGGGVIINQVPEPVTLSLLGLGGLALLRRRRS
jgi:hypothetical protein